MQKNLRVPKPVHGGHKIMEAAGCVSESLWRETLLKKDSPSKLSQHNRQLEL